MDAACQVANLSKTILFQKQRDLHAARAVVADADDRLLRVKFGQLSGDGIHRHRQRPVNMTGLEFLRLTYVE